MDLLYILMKGRKNMKRMKSGIALLLAAAMIATVPAQATAASKKPALSAKKLSITRGKTAVLKLKRATKYTATWKTSKKKIVSISKKTKTKCTLKALKKGTSTITCKVKKGKKTITLSCKVTVTVPKKPKNMPDTDPTTAPTDAPVQSPTSVPTNAPTASPTAVPTAGPTAVPTPEPTKHPLADESILENYKGLFGYVGTCLTYRHGNKSMQQMQDADTMAHVKKHYNSFTLENEMKPDAMLSSSPTPISVAEAKKLGYTIPDNFKEKNVPKLNLENLDDILKTAHDNGLRMRAHTLVWHSQTPAWFFTEDFDGKNPVSPETMDARLEFYVRTVMKYVMDKELSIAKESGSIVYAWDVVNEYLNRPGFNWAPNWTSVYGDMGDSPSYVKKAFEIAYDVLKEYKATDKVTLFYNDYNTYWNVEKVINLVNFINDKEPEKICRGIGMQSHIDIQKPTIEEYGEALEQFMNTGLEVQITELDITINFHTDGDNPTYNYKNEGETDEEQADFTGDFMDMVIQKQLNRDKTMSPKGITGITLWGLYDKVSWRSRCNPLLFSKNINDPKPSFYRFIEAAKKVSQN